MVRRCRCPLDGIDNSVYPRRHDHSLVTTPRPGVPTRLGAGAAPPRSAATALSGTPGSPVSTWTQTWSAPAARCSSMRRRIASLVAPGDDGVDQAVTDRRDVLFGESRPQQVVGVVRGGQVARRKSAAIVRASAGSVDSTTPCSGSSSGPAPSSARAVAVCSGSGQVRVGATGPAGGQGQHLGAERRQHPVLHRHRLVRGVEAVEILRVAASGLR